MAARKRACSEVSGDESETIETVRCYAEMVALKAFEEGLDSEYYPCIVLEDSTVFEKDGRTVANLLNVELGGPYIVRGRLVVDNDISDCLQHKKYQGQYIEISDCQGFSIGIDPIVLWALGRSGWLEIRPSRQYMDMYSKMAEGISIYFFLTVLYETTKEKYKKSLSMDQIFLQYGKSDGTGLVKAEVSQRFKNHTEFLLSQMGRVESSINWKASTIFGWLKSIKPDINQKLHEQRLDGNSEQKTKAAVTRVPGTVQVCKIRVFKSAQNHIVHAPVKPAIQKNLFGLRPPAQSEELQMSGIGSLVSPEDTSTIGIILQVLEKNYGDRHKLTLSKLGTELYYRYSISKYQLAHAIIKVYAKEVFAALTGDWAQTPVYQSLRDYLKLNEVSEYHEEASKMVLRARVRKGESRIQDITSKTRASEVPRNMESPPASLQFIGKTVPRDYGGQRSGKEAVLRLASSSTKRSSSSTDDSSEEDQSNDVRQRKRQRPLPQIETGSSEVDEQDLEDDNDSHSKLKTEGSLSIVNALLPTIKPRGPNGMWACHKEGCTFIVRNAREDERRKMIREHFLEHADIITRESLVLEEARPHLPVNHLLEKLRGLGEIGSINEDRDTPSLNGVPVPRRLKRHGMVT